MLSLFFVGSTPSHLQSRFMVWNSVGVVKCLNDDSENSIDVEFHDTRYSNHLILGIFRQIPIFLLLTKDFLLVI